MNSGRASRSEVPPALSGAALCSGAAALFYESLWTRSLSIVLGSTVRASAVVFSAFLVGLALGALLVGRSSRAARNVTRTYVGLELSIAISAPFVGFLLERYSGALASLSGGYGAPLRIVRDFIATLVCVALPTALMGGTFPTLLAIARRAASHGGAIARVYATNTFGAAIGAVLSGTVTIGFYGVGASYAIAAALNLSAALLVLRLPPLGAGDEIDASSVDAEAASRIEPKGAVLLAVASASSGALVLAVEVVWARFSSYFLGNRSLAAIILLGWVLIWLALGAALVGRASRFDRTSPWKLLSATFVVSAFGVLLSPGIVSFWIVHQPAMETALPGNRALLLPYRVLETGLLLAPSLLPLGCAFPLCLAAIPGGRAEVGRVAGALYGANTVGAVAGSLVTGGWAVAALGSFAWCRWLACACLCVAALLHLAAVPRRKVAALWALGVPGFVVLASLVGPRELSIVASDERLIRRVEDEYGVFQVTDIGNGRLRTRNNRTALVYVLGSPDTRYVQAMQGHLGVWFAPWAKRALVLGSGYGISAGALGLYESLEHIDAVEILPAMVAAAPLFASENFRYHENPRISVIVDDARHFIATRSERYDVVSVNMTDPYLPGASALFHADFYDVVKRHLAPRGVLLQHAFGSDIDIVLKTIGESFPYIRLFRAYDEGMNVVASLGPLTIDEAALHSIVAREPVRSALRRIGFAAPLTPAAFARSGWTQSDFPAYFHRSVPVATDDHPRLEFSVRGGAEALLFSNH